MFEKEQLGQCRICGEDIEKNSDRSSNGDTHYWCQAEEDAQENQHQE